jgi:hypothetical protein
MREIRNACDMAVTEFFRDGGSRHLAEMADSVPQTETPLERLFIDRGDWVGVYGYYESRVRARIACVVRVRQDARLGQRIWDIFNDEGIKANIDLLHGLQPVREGEVTVTLVSDYDAFRSGIPTGQAQVRRIDDILRTVSRSSFDCVAGEPLCMVSSGSVPGWYLLDPHSPMTPTPAAAAVASPARAAGSAPSVPPPPLQSPPSAVACWLRSPTARITNVNEYANLRFQPDFASTVLRQLPLGEQVRVLTPHSNILVSDRNNSCRNACQAFSRNPNDRQARDIVQQCINDNILWYEITDARGNRGWVSRRFLQEVE